MLAQSNVIVATAPELMIDLDLPAHLPSRYRVRLSTVTRLEARVRFPFPPAVFRGGDIRECGAEILLLLGRQALQLQGSLEPERDGRTARIRFLEPISLPDYALLRRACGLDDPPQATVVETASGASPESADLVSVGTGS